MFFRCSGVCNSTLFADNRRKSIQFLSKNRNDSNTEKLKESMNTQDGF